MKVAIQGELGSNSHMAALAMLEDVAGAPGAGLEIAACATSAEVFERVVSGTVDGAVLPIENSLHGSVAEHYDLLLAQPVRIARESLLRVRHNLIVRPGVAPDDIKRVMSHPVALSQCRHWLAARPWLEVVNFYDTAGSVKHLMAEELDDTAGIAPELAARQYGAEVLVAGIEDHAENFTRFHLLLREPAVRPGARLPVTGANKSSLAFSVEHRPGSLVRALEEFARAGVNLTKIESRPVPGQPWEYVFFVDLRFDSAAQIDGALAQLARHCHMVKELGRYVAA
ncbi:MAG: prephenate dehydratase [Acidobacteriaceae bacterium]